jgi:large exoprotein involved in heme utilization and adhesion
MSHCNPELPPNPQYWGNRSQKLASKFTCKLLYGLLSSSICIAVSCLGIVSAQAQVVNNLVPDNTLGTENSIVTPGANQTLIQGGAVRGGNLFHSFQGFSIGTNQALLFDNAATIQNILVRVTGTERSGKTTTGKARTSLPDRSANLNSIE